jgi:hypothetical protein
MVAILIATLAHHVTEQHTALSRICHVLEGGTEKTKRRAT